MEAVSRLRSCPKCRALLESSVRACPYCGVKQRTAPPPQAGETDARATTQLGIWIIAFNVAIYALTVLLDPAPPDGAGSTLEPSRESVVTYGACERMGLRACGQYWRFFTATFIHFGVVHLLFNMIALFVLIPLAAVTLGADRTTCIYLTAGVFGALVSYLFRPYGVAGGASGAVCGVIAALGVWGKRRGGIEGEMLSRRMVMWGIIILAFGLMPGVGEGTDNVAHAGGFVAGAALGWIAAAARGSNDRVWKSAAFASVAAFVIVGAVWLVPSVFRGLDRHRVLRYDREVSRTFDRLFAVDGSAAAQSLPAWAAEGPAGTTTVSTAMNEAVRAMKEDPKSGRAREALAVAAEQWRRWRDTLGCSHGIWWHP